MPLPRIVQATPEAAFAARLARAWVTAAQQTMNLARNQGEEERRLVREALLEIEDSILSFVVVAGRWPTREEVIDGIVRILCHPPTPSPEAPGNQ